MVFFYSGHYYLDHSKQDVYYIDLWYFTFRFVVQHDVDWSAPFRFSFIIEV